MRFPIWKSIPDNDSPSRFRIQESNAIWIATAKHWKSRDTISFDVPGKIKTDLISLETSTNDFICHNNIEGFISEVIVTLSISYSPTIDV